MSYPRTQIKKLVENSIAMAEQAAEYYNREIFLHVIDFDFLIYGHSHLMLFAANRNGEGYLRVDGSKDDGRWIVREPSPFDWAA